MNWAKLQKLDKEKIMRLQNKKIQHFFKHYIHFIPYYAELLQKEGIDYEKIASVEDLKKIPFTTKEDIAPTIEKKENPQKIIMQPNKELIRKYYPKSKLLFSGKNIKRYLEYEFKPLHVHFTTGRTSLAVPFFYTQRDLSMIEECGKRMLDVFGVKKDYRCINVFPYAPHLAFWQTFFALKATSLTAIQTGGGKVLGTEKIINGIENFKANVIIGMPGYIYHIMKIASEEKKNFKSLKYIIFGGERIPQRLREKIADLAATLNAPKINILATYAFTEGKTAWAECCSESGYHLYPDIEFIEIIDNNNQRVGENEKGEIVYTALDWRGSVVLRYKTGDIGKLHYEKCNNCSRTVPRIDNVIERSSEIREFQFTKIRGTLVNLNMFFPLLMANKNIDEWQVEIKKKNNDPYEIDEVVLYVYTKQSNKEEVKREIQKILHNEMEINAEVIFLSKKEMIEKLGIETELKEKRIIDARPK